MNDKPPLLELDGIEVHFQNASLVQKLLRHEVDTVRAVDDVSLTLGENEVLTLVGESGCGKTTLGKTAVGLQRPTGGSVKYRGQDIWEAKEGNGDGHISYKEIRRALQIIHQDPGSSLNPSKTVLTSLMAPLKRWHPKLSSNKREGMIHRILKRIGMKPPEAYINRYPHQLSGGEQQRVALARVLLMQPDVILADEAVSALDVSLRVDIMDLMHELQDLVDTSYIFISHDLSNARYFTEKVGGQIGVMYLGELVELGPAEEVIHNPKHPYTKVLSWATPILDPIEAAEASDKPPVRKIDIPDPTDPPSGCSFHPRCPEARKACQQEIPELIDDGEAKAACHRLDQDHWYWNSEMLEDEPSSESPWIESRSIDAHHTKQ